MSHQPTDPEPSCGCASHKDQLSPEELALTRKNAPVGKPEGPVAWLFVGMVRFYQKFISPLLPPACRFTPSCSEYMRQAVIKHGAVHGTLLGTRRLLRCHPFTQGGYDPVP